MCVGPETSPDDPSLAAVSSRRTFLFRAGLLLNAIALTAFALPVIGYLLAPMRRATFLKWISLGWRLVFLRTRRGSPSILIRFASRGTAPPPTFRAGSGALPATPFRFFPPTVRTLAVPCDGSQSRNFSCAHAMAVLSMLMALALPVHRRVASTSIRTKLRTVSCGSRPARCR